MNMPVTVNKDLCIGCGACLDGCPVGALELDENGLAEVNEDACIDCGACLTAQYKLLVKNNQAKPAWFFVE